MTDVSPRVLLVEDDNDTREMYAIGLEAEGVRVRAASNVADGFAIALAWQPDVVVTDFMLRAPLTGADLCRQLHSDVRTHHIRTLVLTGSSRSADLDTIRDAGCAVIRIKPWLPDRLVSDVRRLAGQRTH